MRTAWSFAFGTCAAVALLVACSGSADVNIPGVTADQTKDSGNTDPPLTDAGTNPPRDSGIVCEPCETPPPDPSCTGTGPCNCGPYTCPDSGTTTDAGSDECVWSANSNPCGAGKYCSATGSSGGTCGKGKCVAIGTKDSSTRSPVCGCDGITYWNEVVAAKSGMSVSKKGACSGNDQATCGGLGSMACPAGAVCNYKLGSDDACKIADASGTCWVLPATCPLGIGNPKGHQCNVAQCADDCTLIKAQQPWVPGGLCSPI